MSKKTSKKRYSMTADELIQKLPIFQQLSESQTLLMKLLPDWQNWLKETCPNSNKTDAILISLHNGKLQIICKNATFASVIKHQQESLLNFFHSQGHNKITKIGISVSPSSANNGSLNSLENNSENPSHSGSNYNSSESSYKTAIEAIHSSQKSVKDKQLSDSLKRLEKTLSRLQKK